MAQTIGQHGVAAFTSPVNGDPLNATVVVANDNSTRSAYVDHDSDPGIHVQSSLLAARPAAGTAGRKWMTTDTGSVKLWFDTGAAWEEIAYLKSSGGTVAGNVSVTGTLGVTGLITATGGVSGNVTGNVTGAVTGNAGTATTLQTSRNINGVAFNGSADITITAVANASTLSGTTLNSPVVASSLTSVGTLTSLTTSGTTSLATSAGALTVRSVPYIWPSAQGTANTSLVNDGSGTLSWTVSGGPLTVVPVTPTVAAPYSVVTGDAGKRVQMNSTVQGSINFGITGTAAIPVGSAIQVAAYGAASNLNHTGELVTTYNPDINSVVGVVGLAAQTDGKVLAGGAFTTVDGGATARNFIARFNTNGSVDTAYNPNANGTVRAIAIQSDGKAVIGGDFGLLAGGVTTRNYLARLNTDGTVDATYDPDLNGNVQWIVLQSDGKALVGGNFTTVAGGATPRAYMARFLTTGAVDTTFVNPLFDGTVRCIALQSDGKPVVCGAFFNAGGVGRQFIARLTTGGALDTTLPNLAPNSSVLSVVVQADQKLVFGGAFQAIVGISKPGFARVSSVGALDTTFNTTLLPFGCQTNVMALMDNKILIGGQDWTSANGATRNRVALINSDGLVDGFNPNANGAVQAFAQPAGFVTIGGQFSQTGGVTRNRLSQVTGSPSGGLVQISAPYSLPNVELPRYAVVMLEKVSATEWWMTESNAS